MASEDTMTRASLAHLVEHALCRRMVRGSIPLGGLRVCECDLHSTHFETAADHVQAKPQTKKVSGLNQGLSHSKRVLFIT